jgi:hypothetical protein
VDGKLVSWLLADRNAPHVQRKSAASRAALSSFGIVSGEIGGPENFPAHDFIFQDDDKKVTVL